jgi:hypothetical protein
MAQNSIICLQEISTMWAGHLHTFFANNDYYLVTGLYGNRNNGYMGVGMAIPTKKYELRAVDITRVADTKRMPRKVYQEPSFFENIASYFEKFLAYLASLVSAMLIWLKLSTPPAPTVDLWGSVVSRPNQLVSCRLRSIELDEEIVVGTYHMPCMFDVPPLMVAHVSLAVQHLQRFAGDTPYVLAGDFNFKPSSAEYRLVTEGTLDRQVSFPLIVAPFECDADSSQDPSYPTPVEGDDWRPDVLLPLRSAYRTRLGEEPSFTNYAQTGDRPVFIDTLDYLFHSDVLEVAEVLPLPSQASAVLEGSLPNDQEPSDHLMLAASFTFPWNNGYK